MDTLHRLAGVTETSDPAGRPSQPLPDPPPIPQEVEADTQNDASSQRAGRVSLPLNRQPSNKSFKQNSSHHLPDDYPPPPTLQGHGRRSHESAQSGGTGVSETDFVWGPSHPCYPHPNPHYPQDTEEAKTTRVIRVKRDWLQAGDLYPQYANLYPEILDPLVSDDEFRFLISNINARLKTIFDPYSTRAWVDAVLGVATGFIWDDLGMTGAKKGIKDLEAFIEKWNAEKARKFEDVKVVQLRKTGFMALDFVIPDPGIEPTGGEDGVQDGGVGPAE